MVQTEFKLNTGATIPAVALGSWQSGPGEVAQAVEAAIKCGYRHVDGAFMYKNEEEVGQGIKKSGIDRKELFVTTKLWSTYHRNPEACLDESLKKLGLDYVDLYLMHWPVPLNPKGNDPYLPTRPDGSRDLDTDSWSYIKTWQAMEGLMSTGKVKAIGVSNCSIAYLEEILKIAKVVPACDQMEVHVLNPELKLNDYCKSKGIILQAYSPLGSTGSPLMKEQIVQDIAKKHDIEAGNVLLSYLNNRGIVVLPKSVTPSRIEKNLKIVDLDKEDIEALNKFAKDSGKLKRFCNPPWGVDFKWDEQI
jgi:glycerol 2-dehydrogenase (NADP+)